MKKRRKDTQVTTPTAEEIGNAAVGAVIGGVLGGPLGAVVGAAAGAMVEKGPEKRKTGKTRTAPGKAKRVAEAPRSQPRRPAQPARPARPPRKKP